MTEELFVKVIETMRVQYNEDQVNSRLIGEVFKSKEFNLYDNSKLYCQIIELLSIWFDKGDLEIYCFQMNFGKPSSDSEWETPQMLYKRLTKTKQ